MAELMIFKAGKYPQGDWPKERVEKMVGAYNPEKFYEAPVVIGHRSFGTSDDYQDAHGWVKSLRMDKSGKVFADVPSFSADVIRKVAEGKLKYMSIEVFENDMIDKSQPPYLRAIALLGRDTPAVAGAKIPTLFSLPFGGFAECANEETHTSTFTQKMDAGTIQLFSANEAEKTTQSREETMDEMTEKVKTEMAAKDARIAALEKENEMLQQAKMKHDAEVFFSQLRDAGKITPACFEKAVALDAKMTEADRKEFRALFSNSEPIADLSGKHTATKEKSRAEFACSADVTAKVKAFQKEKGFASFTEAAEALYSANPEMFSEEE
ncbi:hypothetical protein ACFGOO_03095 [Treponema vincentii]|uniref:hypothetical protein n=1 Tax=Treponema vincentii TaxID=69710 RepID=UPI0035F5744D